nr:hypothetical protein [uncultured Adlercreutzia sp.]
MGNTWENLSRIQLGLAGEYYARMLFLRHGFRVYAPCADDHGVDFIAIAPKTNSFYAVQVKSVRDSYTFIAKDKLPLDDNHLVCYVRFPHCGEPELFIIPAREWESPNALLTSRGYGSKKSASEYGINCSQKARSFLKAYASEHFFDALSG